MSSHKKRELDRPKNRGTSVNVPAVVCGASLILLWGGLVFLANQPTLGAAELADKLFAPALAATYIGAWLLALAIARERRKVLFASIIGTLTIFAVVALFETAAAFKVIDWEYTLRRLAGETQKYDATYVTDAELSFRRIPELQWSESWRGDVEKSYGIPSNTHKQIRFTYDQWGYRNAEEMKNADVVLIGDSFVEGHNVSDHETVAANLQSHLGKTVANLGIAGYGTLQGLRVLKGDAAQRNPQAVVWFLFEGNDLYEDQEFENAILAEPTAPTPIVAGSGRQKSWTERSFTNAIFKRIRYWSHPLIPRRPPHWAYLSVGQQEREIVYFYDYGAVPWTDYEQDRWAITKDALLEGARYCNDQGIELIIAYVPTKYRVYRDFIQLPEGSEMAQWSVWPLPEIFGKFCEDADLTCVDLTPPLIEHTRTNQNPYFHTDTHWSTDGHAAVASIVADMLKDDSSPPDQHQD